MGEVIILIHIVFFEYIFQFCLERAKDRIDQSFGIQIQPFLQLKTWKVVVVKSHVVRSSRIQTFPTHAFHQIGKFIGISILRS